MIAPSLAWIVVTLPLRSNVAWPDTTCCPATSARAGAAASSAIRRFRAIDRVQLRVIGSLRGGSWPLLEHDREQGVDLGVVAPLRAVREPAARPRQVDAGAYVAQQLEL